MVRVFVSYSHGDDRWLRARTQYDLIPWLEESLRRDQVEFWYDRNLEPGEKFRERIEAEIDRADVANLRVSQAFVNSDFIERVELPRIEACEGRGEMVVIPILVGPCDWDQVGFLRERHILPGEPTPLIDYTESDRAFEHIRVAVLRAIRRRLLSQRAQGPVENAVGTARGGLRVPAEGHRQRSRMALGIVSGMVILVLLALILRLWTTRVQGALAGASSAVPVLASRTATPHSTTAPLPIKASERTSRPGHRAGQEAKGPDGGIYVWVPAGAFTMGSSEQPDSRPTHRVVIGRGFWVAKHEVTMAQYDVFRRRRGGLLSLIWPGASREAGASATLPRTGVTWYEAQSYCRYFGVSLPTEAEWEYGARGATRHKYPWGSDFSARNCCYEGTLGPTGKASPVGSFPKGASWCGALDMAGNAWEWCADWYSTDYYAHSPLADPQGPQHGQARVLRGGSWFDSAATCASTFRFSLDPSLESDGNGFRCIVRPVLP